MKDKMSSLREVLADFRDDYSLCGKCKLCHACDVMEVDNGRFWRNCPSGTRFGYEGYYASGRLEMARALELDEIEVTPALRHSLYSCMLCGSCEDRCYTVKQMYPMRVFELLREKAVREGWGPLEEHGPVLANLESSDNVLGIPQGRRRDWAAGLELRDAVKDGAEALLFVGCTYSFEPGLKETARSAARLLQRAGLDVGILGSDELCCGSPLLQLGDRDFFEAFAEENIRRIEATKADLVVSLCPHCSWVLAEEYSPFMRPEVKHATELISDAVSQGKLDASVEVKAEAAWHDPCRLGRRLGVYDAPRAIMDSIPGLESVELPRNRHNALCCGGGGWSAYADPEYGEWVAKERVYEAESVGVDRLVTACPHCEEMLARGAEAKGSEVTVENIFSLLERSTGGGDR